MKALNVAAVIEHLGGGATLARELTKLTGETVKPMVIYQWKRRNRIPGDWIAKLIELAENKNKQFNLKDFMNEEINS